MRRGRRLALRASSRVCSSISHDEQQLHLPDVSSLLFGLHLPKTGKRVLRVLAQLVKPPAQFVFVPVQVPGRLGERYAALPAQRDHLKLELAAELPSLHWTHPVPKTP